MACKQRSTLRYTLYCTFIGHAPRIDRLYNNFLFWIILPSRCDRLASTYICVDVNVNMRNVNWFAFNTLVLLVCVTTMTNVIVFRIIFFLCRMRKIASECAKNGLNCTGFCHFYQETTAFVITFSVQKRSQDSNNSHQSAMQCNWRVYCAAGSWPWMLWCVWRSRQLTTKPNSTNVLIEVLLAAVCRNISF